MAELVDSGTVPQLIAEAELEIERARERVSSADTVELPSEAELAVLQLLDTDLSVRQIGPLFDGMTLTRDHGNTIFVGRVRDRAELFGFLQRFADLRLKLLSVDTIDQEAKH
jgi:hypothetical protein